MTEAVERTGGATPPPQHGRHPRLWFGIALVAVLILLNIVLGLTGHVIAAPRWVVARVEARANAALEGVVSAKVGGLELVVDRSFVPHVTLAYAERALPAPVMLEGGVEWPVDALELLHGEAGHRDYRTLGHWRLGR